MNQRQMQRYHNKLCKELGIQPTEVVALTYEQAKAENRTGWFKHSTRKIYVYYHGSKRHSPEWVVAHETKHWADYYNGRLTATHYRGTIKRYWKKRGPWSTWPWEKSANRYANKVTK